MKSADAADSLQPEMIFGYWIARDPDGNEGFRIIEELHAGLLIEPKRFHLPDRVTAEHFLVARGIDILTVSDCFSELALSGRAIVSTASAS